MAYPSFLMTGTQNPQKTPKLPEIWGDFLNKNKLKFLILVNFPGGGRETVKMTPFWGSL